MPVSEWWQWLLLVVVSVVIAAFSILLYRRDTVSLPRPVAAALLTLRLIALLGLLVFFLGPEKRSEARIVKPSQLAVLVDTSLSMGLEDRSGNGSSQRRVDSVVQLFEQTPLIEQLNQQHELSVYRFGDTSHPEPIATLPKVLPTASESESGRRGIAGEKELLGQSGRIGWLALAGLAVATLLLLTTVFLKLTSGPSVLASWTLASGSLAIAAGVAALAVADLITSQYQLPVSLGWQQPANETDARLEADPSSAIVEPGSPADEEIDWGAELSPRAIATRLGTALQDVVNNSRGSALAGIVLVTDGRNNQGTAPARAIASASDANIPVYVIGVGSNLTAQNVRISEMEAPQRVFPDDKFNIKALVQSFGLQGETVRVRLLSIDDTATGTEVTEDERSIQLGEDGEPTPVKFEVSQQAEGRRRYTVELVPPAGDLDSSDNRRSAVVQVQLQKTRVLLIAGGPTRDYQFLRNQLFRDDNVELDVWLQMAAPGADQESDLLLFDFPATADKLNEYDCIVAFDPDWRILSVEQTRWLERWVSEKAGGMIVVAGPVFTPEWTRRPRGDEAIDLIRGLYPVSFYSQGSATLKLGRFGGKQAFPLDFSREGRTARHLWLGEQAADSLANWDAFAGVFGFYAVNEAKAGADVLALFSDETTAVDDQFPIYLASHFYGAGRVFFQASGEIWRLRTVDVNFFQSYYLNLIRWVSEGRLLRDSTRGVLLLDRNRCWVGDQLVVRAILRDAADQPLMKPQVNATVKFPNGVAEQIQLVNIQDAGRPGTFTGQFVVSLEGNYEIGLPMPYSPDRRVLRGSVVATIPDLEKVRPERNDLLLQEIADRTGGRYFYDVQGDGTANRSVSTASGTDGDRPSDIETKPTNLVDQNSGLHTVIGVVDQELFLPGSPDEPFARKLASWLILWLTLVLCSEWIIRRLHKLA